MSLLIPLVMVRGISVQGRPDKVGPFFLFILFFSFDREAVLWYEMHQAPAHRMPEKVISWDAVGPPTVF